ncbi:MAG: DUF1919 domain-containing protein [Kiritimatiellae bacterium]|jgi:uncharacterized protein (DUF1919 family)|nr:DUF1919 domain-containing protein [Kiritimatiellia bacterium]
MIFKIQSQYEKKIIGDFKFAIITNNCWGYDLYKSLDRKYNTPFVGLFMTPDSYLSLLEDLEGNLQEELQFADESTPGNTKYPVGLLPSGIKIHFMHYETQEEANFKWRRRCQRLLQDIHNGVDVFVVFCIDGGGRKDHVRKFQSLSYQNKIALGTINCCFPCYLYLPQMAHFGSNEIVNGKRLYRYRYCYFDVAKWIINKRIQKSMFSRLFSVVVLDLFVYKSLIFLSAYYRKYHNNRHR